jgi:predicted phosphodiesterase
MGRVEGRTEGTKQMTKQTPTQKLIQLVRRPISLNDLCDRLDMSPAKVLALAAKAHIKLDKGNDHLQLSAREQIRTVQQSRITPTVGKRQHVGVISDLHLGSKYCLRAQLKDCVSKMYARGIREILIPGDLLDGCYKHGVFELSHTGLNDQTQDLYETLPRLKGLTYHAITGNHDHTFAELTGVDVGEFIAGYFAKRGRKDIRFYGDCGAFIKIRGAIVHLWHPLGGMSYAKSYKLQKQVEKYGAGEKPDILIGGHVHQFALVEDRGVFALLCPTFQASGSAFSKRLGGQPALGGLILSWEIAGKDLLREFAVDRIRYYEVELAQKARR